MRAFHAVRRPIEASSPMVLNENDFKGRPREHSRDILRHNLAFANGVLRGSADETSLDF